MSFDTLTTVYIGNFLGIGLMLTLFFSNIWRATDNSDLKSIMRLLLIAGLSCVADPIVYSVDGHPGSVVTAIIYIGNSWLYLANMLTGKFWVDFIVSHLGIRISRVHKNAQNLILVFGILCLFVNIYYPIIFSVRENVYKREFFYWIYVCVAAVFMTDGYVLYRRARRAGGVLKFFPISVFQVPVIVGVAVQSLFYGISVIWTSVTIAMAGVMTALKNEVIFQDRLTGLYNRTYLDYLQKGINQKKSAFVTGIMIDLNDFKAINDRFGHGTGDDALITVSEIFRACVGDLGNVIRYAGDEFVILLNTVDEQQVQTIIERIRTAMNDYNRSGQKPYNLSAAMGYAALDLHHQSMNDFMNTIDRRMYEDKSRYYNEKQQV